MLAHARALLTSDHRGATTYLDADLRDPEKILNHPDLPQTLDLSRPVALILVAILHFIPDTDDPYGVVSRLLAALPSGSYLAISHATSDFMPPQTAASVDSANTATRVTFQMRNRTEVTRFLDGLEPAPPGIVPVADWRAENEPQPRPSARATADYAAVARIP